ncbi:hypothetical protein BDZ45DRAFT_371020 [Acephala macrosclerotiorum]|nr:hypothetical protein BDZ45DRAFT_371020 [Acephala macrosclerotiorum]
MTTRTTRTTQSLSLLGTSSCKKRKRRQYRISILKTSWNRVLAVHSLPWRCSTLPTTSLLSPNASQMILIRLNLRTVKYKQAPSQFLHPLRIPASTGSHLAPPTPIPTTLHAHLALKHLHHTAMQRRSSLRLEEILLPSATAADDSVSTLIPCRISVLHLQRVTSLYPSSPPYNRMNMNMNMNMNTSIKSELQHATKPLRTTEDDGALGAGNM